jgi:hypothetical protein
MYEHPPNKEGRPEIIQHARILVKTAGKRLSTEKWADVSVEIWDKDNNAILSRDGTGAMLIPSKVAPPEFRDRKTLQNPRNLQRKAKVVDAFVVMYLGKTIEGAAYFFDFQDHVHAYSDVYDKYLLDSASAY